MNTTIVSSMVNDAIVLAGVAGTLFGFGQSKWFQATLTFAKGEGENVVKGVEALLSTPVAKTTEGQLQQELTQALSQLKDSALAQYAQAAIAGAKQLYDELSPAEQAAAIAFVQKYLPTSLTVTEQEIVTALKSAPALAQRFADDATFAKAQELTALLAQANAPIDATTVSTAPQEATGNATA